MKSIAFERIQEIEDLKNQAAEIYERIDNIAQELYRKHGETESSFEIEEDESGNHWIRLKIVDNIKRLKEGLTLFKPAIFKPIDIEIRRLKNKPK
jgi:hypothetical protein